jgi:hypothetical protein
MKLSVPFCLTLVVSLAGSFTARAAVVSGDVAIIGYRSDDLDGTSDNGNDDAFAWVPLVSVAPFHEIYFTDDGWTAAGTFRGVEGALKYTAPAGGLSAGTVMRLDYSRDASRPGVHTFQPDPGLGSYVSFHDAIVGDQGFETATSGDNLFVFDGSTAAPNFLFGLKTEDGVWDGDATSNDSSALPAALAVANLAVGAAGNVNFDNGRYVGPSTGTRANLLAAITDPGNWQLSETDNFAGDITNGVADFNIVSTTFIPEPSPLAIWLLLAITVAGGGWWRQNRRNDRRDHSTRY